MLDLDKGKGTGNHPLCHFGFSAPGTLAHLTGRETGDRLSFDVQGLVFRYSIFDIRYSIFVLRSSFFVVSHLSVWF